MLALGRRVGGSGGGEAGEAELGFGYSCFDGTDSPHTLFLGGALASCQLGRPSQSMAPSRPASCLLLSVAGAVEGIGAFTVFLTSCDFMLEILYCV